MFAESKVTKCYPSLTHGLTHSQGFTRLDVSYKKRECYPSLTHGLNHSQAFTRRDVSYMKQECYPSLTHGLTHSQAFTSLVKGCTDIVALKYTSMFMYSYQR
jgi:hypothetical protein